MAQGVNYGDYYLIGRLAQGGMAEVFLAKSMLGDHDNELLALKRTLSQFSGDQEFVSMFTDEARIASGLKHPNICRIYDQGQLADQRFIVMEFIHGKDLKVIGHRAKQRNEAMPHHVVAHIFIKIAEALQFAHDKCNAAGEPEAIVHRDVSPQNILISYDGIPKLIDFGIAKAKDRLAKTQAGVVKGKFAYMSPEQAIGAEVDWRTDIFALGVVLYELLTGELPFQGASDFSTLKKIAKADYIKPAADLPPRLLAVLDRCLTRSADERYDSGQQMADDLERFLEADGRNAETSAVSSYMRKLFRDDYIREMSRIRKYIDMPVPKRSAVDVPRPSFFQEQDTRPVNLKEEEILDAADVEIEDEDEDEDEAGASASTDLAAGFDLDEEPTGLAELLEHEDLDNAGDGDVVVDEPDPLDTTDANDASEALAALDEAAEVNLAGNDFDEPTVSIPAGGFSFVESTDETPFEDTGERTIERPAVDVDPEAGKSTRDLSDAVEQVIADDDDLADETISIEIAEELEGPTKPFDSVTADLSEEPERARESSKPKRRPTSSPLRRRVTGSVRRAAGNQPRATGRARAQGRRPSQRARAPGIFSGGELTTLAVAALAGVLLVCGTYYVTHYGVPAFASGLRPAIEAFIGEVPAHGSERQQTPPDSG